MKRDKTPDVGVQCQLGKTNNQQKLTDSEIEVNKEAKLQEQLRGAPRASTQGVVLISIAIA